jgi:hypothetical protein
VALDGAALDDQAAFDFRGASKATSDFRYRATTTTLVIRTLALRPDEVASTGASADRRRSSVSALMFGRW